MEKYIKALQILIDFEIAIMHKKIDKIKELLTNTEYTSYFSKDEKQMTELVRLQGLAIELL
jgi:hypothetical protein